MMDWLFSWLRARNESCSSRDDVAMYCLMVARCSLEGPSLAFSIRSADFLKSELSQDSTRVMILKVLSLLSYISRGMNGDLPLQKIDAIVSI